MGPTDVRKRIVAHTGNRGIALAMLGILWILTAVGIAFEPLRRAALLHELLPVWVRVVLWGGPGVLALLASVWRKLDVDAWGWLIVPAVVTFTSFFFGWICSLLVRIAGWRWLDTWAYPSGWRGATTIAVFVVLIRVCAAGLDRPAPTYRPEG